MTSNSITADGYNIPNTFDTGTTWSEKVTVDGQSNLVRKVKIPNCLQY